MVLLQDDSVQAEALAENIRRETEAIDFGLDPPMTITVTIGVDTATATVTINELVSHADLALYRGKRLGKNRVVHHQDLQGAGAGTSIDVEMQGFEDRIKLLSEHFAEQLAERGTGNLGVCDLTVNDQGISVSVVKRNVFYR